MNFGGIESMARVSAAVEKLTPTIETPMLNFKGRKGNGLWYNLFKIIFLLSKRYFLWIQFYKRLQVDIFLLACS
jgi:hypothetical protein